MAILAELTSDDVLDIAYDWLRKPGRHIMGSNMLWYFNTPCGGRTEYFADMDRLTENWESPIWEENQGYAMWIMD